MSDPQRNSVLRRKTEAGRTSVAASRQVTPAKALASALVHMADARLGLVASVPASSGRISTLAELLETLPEGGLLAVLEGPGDVQGLLVLDAPFLSSVIEKMMTGRLAARPTQPRRPTRTDAALTADLIDDLLRRFEAPFLGHATARWASGFGYASYLDDPRPLGLMLEDIDYRTFALTVDLENGARKCGLVLALPAEGRAPVALATPGATGRAPAQGQGQGQGKGRGPSARSGAEQAGTGTQGADAAREEREAEAAAGELTWQQALEQGVLGGAVALTAVLHRFNLSIAGLETMRVGQEFMIPAEALDACALVGVDGTTVATGRLGQSRAMRALRLPGEPDAYRAPPAAQAGLAPPDPRLGTDDPDAEPGAPGPVPALPDPSRAMTPALPNAEGSGSGDAGIEATGAGQPLEALPDLPMEAPLPDLPDLPDLPSLT